MHNLKTLKLLAKGRLIKTFLPSKRKITDYFIEVAYKRFNPEDIKVILEGLLKSKSDDFNIEDKAKNKLLSHLREFL
jgi:hypothetical protein